MGLQVSCRVRPQEAEEGHFRADPLTAWADSTCSGQAERVPNPGGTSDARSCAHVHRDSAQTRGCFGDWVSEREECRCDCPAERQRAELLWRTLLGSRLRGVHGWI